MYVCGILSIGAVCQVKKDTPLKFSKSYNSDVCIKADYASYIIKAAFRILDLYSFKYFKS